MPVTLNSSCWKLCLNFDIINFEHCPLVDLVHGFIYSNSIRGDNSVTNEHHLPPERCMRRLGHATMKKCHQQGPSHLASSWPRTNKNRSIISELAKTRFFKFIKILHFLEPFPSKKHNMKIFCKPKSIHFFFNIIWIESDCFEIFCNFPSGTTILITGTSAQLGSFGLIVTSDVWVEKI